jgi:hypothetical protein
MNADGSDIHQISFNQSHDMDPTVLTDGRIVYALGQHRQSRHDQPLHDESGRPEQRVLYGLHSHDTGPNAEVVEFVEPQERLTAASGEHAPVEFESHLGAALVAIDTANYTDHDRPTLAIRAWQASAGVARSRQHHARCNAVTAWQVCKRDAAVRRHRSVARDME